MAYLVFAFVYLVFAFVYLVFAFDYLVFAFVYLVFAFKQRWFHSGPALAKNATVAVQNSRYALIKC